ncbi:MAG: tetratricopeptide repeat protein, partial [Synergistaceae bacterium]|nr:tetratricopeptide repeat protein [Synergistaceae bacterium]
MTRKFFGILWTFLFLACAAAPSLAAVGSVPDVPPKASDPPSSSVVTLYRRAGEQAARRDWPAAEALVNTALGLDPAYFPLWELKAEILLGAGRHDEAAEAIQVLIDRDPDDMRTRVKALEIVLSDPRLSNVERSRKMRQVLENISSRQAMSNVLFELLRHSEKSREYLTPLLGAWERFRLELPEAWSVLGLYAKRETEQALLTLGNTQSGAIPIPLLGAIYFIIAKDMASEKAEEALPLLDRARAFGYPAVDCVNLKGWIYVRKKRFAEAADAWESLWRKASDPEQWIMLIANARAEASDYEKMRDILRDGLAVFPKNPYMQGKYIYALYKLGEEDERKKFELRLDSLNEAGGLSYGRALVFVDKKDIVAARREMEKAVLFEESMTGRRFTGNDLEDWLVHMDEGGNQRRGGSMAPIFRQEALTLRDRGWNYWQEREYRKAYDVWLEALDIGFPEARPFIMNITMRLLEVGMPREAVGLLKKYEPDVPPFSFAHRLRLQNRWDIVLPLLTVESSNRYSPWDTLYKAYGALRIGNAAALSSGMEKLGTTPIPRKEITFAAFDDQGRIVTHTLKPADYLACLVDFAADAMRMKNPKLVLQIIGSTQWREVAEDARRRTAVAVAEGIVLQKDWNLFGGFMKRTDWRLIPGRVQTRLVGYAAREILRQRDLSGFMSFLELPQWKGLPRGVRSEMLFAAAEEILSQELIDLFPLFIDNPHWKELPREDRSGLLVRAGRLLYRYGREDGAVPYFEAAGTADPSNVTPFLYLSLIEKKRENGEKARAYLEKGLAGKSPEADREYALGMTAFLDGDETEAAGHFLAYVRLVPDDAFIRYQTINLLLARNRFEEARELKDGFEEMYRRENSAIDAYVALTRWQFGETRDAEAIWAKLYAEHPGRLDYLANWGRVLNAQGKFEYTIHRLAEPCRSTKDLRLATALTEACFGLQLYEDVLIWVETGLDASPNESLLLRFGAESAEALGMYDRAKSYADRFLELSPDSFSVQALRMRSLMNLGEWSEVHTADKELL